MEQQHGQVRRILPLPKRRIASLSALPDSPLQSTTGPSTDREGATETPDAQQQDHAEARTPLFSNIPTVGSTRQLEVRQTTGASKTSVDGHVLSTGHDVATLRDSEGEEDEAPLMEEAGGSNGHPVLHGEHEEDDTCSGCRDWLDNVKNKKKRKIPTSAATGHSHGILAGHSGVGNGGSSNSASGHGGHGGATAVPFASALGQGLHLARQRASMSGGHASAALSRRRRTWDASGAASASASASTDPSSAHGTQPPQPGQAPLPALSHASSTATPATASTTGINLSKPFDFSCASPVAHNLPSAAPPAVPVAPPPPVTVATQTTPSLADLSPILPPRRFKTAEEKEDDRIRLVRRQRRALKQKLKPGEQPAIWICQFCEFESVFGYAPLALIEGYTERMRSARRAAQERARLLEKARSKGKKKKGKAASASTTAAATPGTTTAANGASVTTGVATTTPTAASAMDPAPPRFNTAPNPPPPPLSTLGSVKKGIDKAIGPTHAGCTCCGGGSSSSSYKRDDPVKLKQAIAAPAGQAGSVPPTTPPVRGKAAMSPPTGPLPPVPGSVEMQRTRQASTSVVASTLGAHEPITC